MGTNRDSDNIFKCSIHGYYGSNICNYSFNCIHIDSVQGNEIILSLYYNIIIILLLTLMMIIIDLTNIKDQRLY